MSAEFKTTIPAGRQFRPLFEQATISEFAVEAHAATRKAVEVSQATFRADVDGARATCGAHAVPDHVRIACDYRARAGDLLEAAMELFEAAETAATSGDLAAAAARRVRALRRCRAVFPV